MVNPRKAYPIDPGLIPIYERAGRANTGHALETAVLLELQRRGCEVHYVRTPAGHEVDFHAMDAEGQEWLVQVCASAVDPFTFERETRALLEAATLHPQARPFLLLLEPPLTPLPAGIETIGALPWFLQPPGHPLFP